MPLLNDILEHNTAFIENKDYQNLITTKTPNEKAVLLTCMDTRLTELLTRALGFKNGDVKVVKNAGATISHPYGSTMRSLLVAIYALGAEEIIIMGHKDCGMGNLDVDSVIDTMKNRGVSQLTLDTIEHSGIDIQRFLRGFDDVTENVRTNINKVYNHPLFDKSVPIHGLVIDPHNGALEVIQNGYEHIKQ
ncbi:carbonic anhydrase [Mammaliicoccus sp. Dog046]|uniref:beta-class carbonic anhydrase n=1 Tax=Mammaliicoccus sp. Dog046 TaxID=3034233 RepID=UPI002B25A2CC|nr:carbonic anhydrase [Mammaliicoccus sp. Dog046]WQK86265.1 carbonic anhydrase [Mammaliicoccus sp. Dog046]